MTSTDAFLDDLLSHGDHHDESPAPWSSAHLSCVRAKVSELTGDVAVCTLRDASTALLPVSEFPPQLRWGVGDELTALCHLEDGQQWLSCNRPELVVLVAHGYVPELRSGELRVMGLARSPGIRTKLAVAPTVEGLDPVTAMVGKAANRVRAVSRELGGERLDVVAWHDDRATYLRNAFAPASVEHVTQSSVREMTVTVPRHQMAAAVGERGLNASLAGQLVGCTVTVVPA